MKLACPTNDIMDYADGKYMTDDKVENIKKHIASCPQCNEGYRRLKLIAKYACYDVKAPQGIQENIMKRIDTSTYSNRKFWFLRRLFKYSEIVKPAAVFIAVIIMTIGFSLSKQFILGMPHQIVMAFSRGDKDEPSYTNAIISPGFDSMPKINSDPGIVYKPLTEEQIQSIKSKLSGSSVEYENFPGFTLLAYDIGNYEYSLLLASDNDGNIYSNSIGYGPAIEIKENSNQPLKSSIIVNTDTKTNIVDYTGGIMKVRNSYDNYAYGKINFTDKVLLDTAYKITLKFGNKEFTKLVNHKKTLLITLPYELCNNLQLSDNSWKVQVYDKSNKLLHEDTVR